MGNSTLEYYIWKDVVVDCFNITQWVQDMAGWLRAKYPGLVSVFNWTWEAQEDDSKATVLPDSEDEQKTVNRRKSWFIVSHSYETD